MAIVTGPRNTVQTQALEIYRKALLEQDHAARDEMRRALTTDGTMDKLSIRLLTGPAQLRFKQIFRI